MYLKLYKVSKLQYQFEKMLKYYSEDTKAHAELLTEIIRDPKMYQGEEENLEYMLDEFVLKDLYKIPQVSYECPNSEEMCEIFTTPTMGRGIRAKKHITKGTKIGCYLGTLKHNTERKSGDDWRYDFCYGMKNYYIDGSQCESMMSILNHSDSPNVDTKYHIHKINGVEEVHIVFITRNHIMYHEELFIDYGEDYWKGAEKEGIMKQKRQSLITDYFSIKRVRDRDDYFFYGMDEESEYDTDDFDEENQSFHLGDWSIPSKKRKNNFDIDCLFRSLDVEEKDWIELGGM